MPNNGMHFRHEINKKYLELPATNEIKQEQELFDKSTEGAERDSTRMDEALSKEEIIRQELFGESTEDRECSHVRNDKILEYKNPQTEAVEGENLTDCSARRKVLAGSKGVEGSQHPNRSFKNWLTEMCISHAIQDF